MNDFIDYFGLKEDPFKTTPDIEYFFASRHHQEALLTLNYLVESDQGFALITGEPGTGKTITIRKFVNQLPDNIVYASINYPNLGAGDLLKVILDDFGVEYDASAASNALMASFRDFLTQLDGSGKRALIIIDEAQSLPEDTLEELRMLSNIESDTSKLLHIVLSGQPALEETLSSPRLSNLRQRISLAVRLNTFLLDETVNYVTSRLSRAANTSITMQRSVFQQVHRASGGIPRLINLIMERAIIAAYHENSHVIKPNHIERALEHLRFTPTTSRNFGSIAKVAASISVGFALALGVFILTNATIPSIKFFSNKDTSTTEVRKPAPETSAARNDTPEQAPDNTTTDASTDGEDTGRDAASDTTAQVDPEPVGGERNPVDEPEPQPEPTPPDATVNVPTLNVRSGPDINTVRIFVLHAGDPLDILSETPLWAEVSFAGENGTTMVGWVYKPLIKIN